MIRKLLLKLTDRLPARAIMDNGEEYMIRFYLGTILRRRMYIHLFLASDPDRGIHNHPWTKAWSFILAGWYFEERRGTAEQGGRRKVTVKWFNRLTADTTHRVILPTTRHVWTLFIHTVGDVQEWGFFKRASVPVKAGYAQETYYPFVYPGGKKNKEWWKTHPTGKQLRESRYVDGQWGGQVIKRSFKMTDPEAADDTSFALKDDLPPATSHPLFSKLETLSREALGLSDIESVRSIFLSNAGVRKLHDIPYTDITNVTHRMSDFVKHLRKLKG